MRERTRERVEEPPAELVVGYYPALGIKAVVAFYRTTSGWRLNVFRSLRGGGAATWTVRYSGNAAARVTQQVLALGRNADVARGCPEWHGRDGITWYAAIGAAGDQLALSYRTKGGEVCKRVERRLAWLMKAGRLECVGRYCLRPEELATGQWTCADGADGAECRESDRRFRR